MSSSKIKKISNVLSAVGIVLLLIALLFGFSFIKIGVQNLVAIDNVEIDIENGEDSRIKTEGKLVSMNTQVSVVSYEVDGNEYSTELQVYTDEFKPGDSLDIYYSKENMLLDLAKNHILKQQIFVLFSLLERVKKIAMAYMLEVVLGVMGDTVPVYLILIIILGLILTYQKNQEKNIILILFVFYLLFQ